MIVWGPTHNVLILGSPYFLTALWTGNPLILPIADFR